LGAELSAQPLLAGLRQNVALVLCSELAGDVGMDQHFFLLTAGAGRVPLALTVRFG
jgi:hypothetical protein